MSTNSLFIKFTYYKISKFVAKFLLCLGHRKFFSRLGNTFGKEKHKDTN